MTKEPHHQLIDHVTRAIGEACETETQVIMKVIEHVDSTIRQGIDPGTDLVASVEQVYRETIAHAIAQNCPLGKIVTGLIVGTFRARRDIREEAHQIIAHLITLVVQTADELDGNIEDAMRGMIEGIAQSAIEERLNLDVALNEAAKDAVAAALSIDPEYGERVRRALTCEVKDVTIRP